MKRVNRNTLNLPSILLLWLTASLLSAPRANAQSELVVGSLAAVDDVNYYFGLFDTYSTSNTTAKTLSEKYPTHYNYNKTLYIHWTTEPDNSDNLYVPWQAESGLSSADPYFSKVWTRNQAIGIKLAADTRYQFSIHYAAVKDGNTHLNGGKIVLTKGDTYSSSAAVIAETPSGGAEWDSGNTYPSTPGEYKAKSGSIEVVTGSDDAIYWLAGNSDYPGIAITGFSVKLLEKLSATTTLPATITTINDNYMWYAPGSAISDSQVRGNITKGQVWFRYLNVAAGSDMVYVNGTLRGSNVIGGSQAMGFKLARGKAYRIQVFSDAPADQLQTLLKQGNNVLESASYVTTDCHEVDIMASNGASTNTRLFTYEIDALNADETFWIAPTARYNVGAVEINVNSYDAAKNLSSDAKFSGSNAYFPDGKTRIIFRTNGNTSAYEAESDASSVPSLQNAKYLNANHGSTENDRYAYNNGPNLPYNAIKHNYGDGSSTDQTVMLNSATKIGLRMVKAGTKITVPFIADTDVALQIWAGSSFGSATKVGETTSTGGYKDLVYTHSGADSYLWLTCNSTSYAYVAGLTVNVPKTVSTNPITGDFIWYADEDDSLPFYNSFENGYLFHNGVDSDPDDATMKVDGRTVYTYSVTNTDASTSTAEQIAFRIADGLDGEIRVYYKAFTANGSSVTYDSGAEPTLSQGASYSGATTSVGTTKNTNENSHAYGVKDYISYAFTSSAPRYYAVSGGKIAAIQVFIHTAATSTEPTVISGPMESWVGAGAKGYGVAGGLINDCEAEVLNANEVVGSYAKFNGDDVALNSFMENGHHAIIIDNTHSVSYKFAPGHKYKVRVYLDRFKSLNGSNEVVSAGFINLDKNTVGTFTLGVDDKTSATNIELWNNPSYTSEGDGYRDFEWDLTSAGSNGEITFGGASYAYFVGIEVTTADPHIEFDTAVNGIFTGQYRGKTLIYCTDNGTLENYIVPKVYMSADGARKSSDIANDNTKYTIELLATYYNETGDSSSPIGTVNNGTGVAISGGRVTGIKDTDCDMLFKVTYTYNYNSVDYSDYYYLWFANYLKPGWWTCRDAKLIVDTDKSYTDKNNIIVGEFYVSSGSEGTLFFEYVTPAKAYATYSDGETTGPESVEYTYTTETNSNRSVTKTIYQNDHKNHTGDAIVLPYPGRDNVQAYWGTADDIDVARSLALTLPRHSTVGGSSFEWPSFTVKLTFHYVKAPELSALSPIDGVNQVQVTTYRGNQFSSSSPIEGTFYYTLDGTRPGANSLIKSTGTSMTTLTNSKSATYYAAEKVAVTKPFYINNPYTTHIEGKTQYELMTEASNRSTDFYATSSVFYSTVEDPDVVYVGMNDGRLEQKNGSTRTNSSFSLSGPGGRVWKYPLGSSSPMMRVMMGTSDIKVFRVSSTYGRNFTESGVTWSIRGTEQHPYTEHLDNQQYAANNTDILEGTNYGSQNADPYTECNTTYGAANTEAGGKWLTPVGGDFLRFEPEYDGVVTVWIRQNGAAQGNEYNGDLTRRPVYVMDENGKIMPRSNVKPSSENYYGIDGVYAEIDEVRSMVRQDFRIAWKNGLTNWRSGFKGNTTGIADYNKAMFRLFNYWYGLPMYQNTDDATKSGDEIINNTGTMDIADSWISRTARVQSVICDNNPIIYRSNHLYDIEADLTFHKTDGSLTDVQTNLSCAKYGWEVPCYNIVRYRFPVKAGKSYYIGGRGTKNMFVATKFDPMPANYNCGTYQSVGDNYNLSEGSFTATPVTNTGWNNNKITDSRETIISNYNTTNLTTYNLYSEESGSNTNAAVVDLALLENGGTLLGTTCNVQLDRTFGIGKWYGIILPFSVSESKMREIFGDDVQVLYVDPYDNVLQKGNTAGSYKSAASPGVYDQKLRFTYHKYQMLYANTPAFICPSKAAVEPLFEHVTIDRTNLNADSYDNMGYKVGVINGYEFYVTGSYRSQAKGEIGEMYYIDNIKNLDGKETGVATVYHSMSGIAMKAGRAYITVKAPASSAPMGSPRLTSVGMASFDSEEFENESSGIFDIVSDDAAAELFIDDEYVYDLMGRVVGYGSTAGLNKGIYLYKGRKVYIR